MKTFTTRTRTGAAVALICVAGLGGAKSNAATIALPVAVTLCATCNNQATLEAAALAYSTKWIGKTPPGYVGQVVLAPSSGLICANQNGSSTILVVSTVAPLSGAFYPCLRIVHNVPWIVMVPINATTDLSVIAADGAMFHRSAKMEPIQLPANLPLVPFADAPELYEAWLAGNLIQTSIEFSLYHLLTSLNIGAVEQGTFKIAGTNSTFTIWSTDTIQVKDADGNTALFQWIPSTNPPWIYKAGSLRDSKGNPIPDKTGAALPKTGGTLQSTGPIEVTYPGGPTMILTPYYGDATPGGSVTVGDPIQDPGPTEDVLATGD
jgi:hypothetical protein